MIQKLLRHEKEGEVVEWSELESSERGRVENKASELEK